MTYTCAFCGLLPYLITLNRPRMNPDLARLQSYPFEKLARLIEGVTPDPQFSAIHLGIGEPQHQPPKFVAESIIAHLHGLANYPVTKGVPQLRHAIAAWLVQRFSLPADSIDAEQHVIPVNGTREALFAFAQCVVDRSATKPLVMMPNPFYQIYEGAALLAGAAPYFINTTAATGWLPDFDSVPDEAWASCQLLYLCSPGNPTGAVIGREMLTKLIGLAEVHDFIIASDECYSEIYFDEANPPLGLLQVAAEIGNTMFRRCVVFHSLSKRSNLPGMRSGFIAGDAEIIRKFLLYRTYHGCAMAPYAQLASIEAWQDELHVKENRDRYREKFDAVIDILRPVTEVSRPDAGFYLWLKVPDGDDAAFAKALYARKNINLLPGSYLSRNAHGTNPGSGYVRNALVAPLGECVVAAQRIKDFIINA